MSVMIRVDLQQPDEATLRRAADAIRSGGVVVYPTETLYGIGADAFNATAIEKVVHAKKRMDNKPILVIIHSRELLRLLASDVSEEARMLMDEFWPGPLTLVFKSVAGLPVNLTGGTGSIGVRIPSSPLCLKLLARCECPLTSTSANVSGMGVPRTVDEIKKALHGGIDIYLDGGVLPESKPSTVLDVTEETPRLLRDGAISFDRIQHIIPHARQE